MTKVRRATPEDVPAMAAVLNGWIDGTDWFPRVFAPEELEGFIRDAVPLREVWVAGDPVCAYLSCNAEAGQVVALYSSVTGQGVGKALMDKVKEGREALWLTTHVPNVAAQRFYRREGFHEVSRHMPEPSETVEEMRMEWAR
jgi:ribosomal protein S18 acetylase RimI-like enzyme